MCRMTDIGVGVCFCHVPPIPMTGMVLSNLSYTTKTDTLQNSKFVSVVIGFCGHTGVIVGGSAITKIDHLPATRLGDPFVGCFTGNMVTGSFTTKSI